MKTFENSKIVEWCDDYLAERLTNGITILHTADGRRLQVPSGGAPTDEEDAKKEKETEGDAGGVGDDDADGDTKEDDEKEREAGERDADDKGDKAGNAGLQKRLKKVIEQRNAYTELGTPEELKKLKADVAEYRKYEQQIEQEEKDKADAEAVKAGRPTVAQQNAALDRMLDQRFGEGAAEDFMAFRDTRKREVARHTRDGLEHLSGLLTAHNLKADTAALEEWEPHIGTVLLRDPELRARFKDPVTQKEALTEAFTRVRRAIVDPSLAAVGAEKLGKAAARKAAAPGNGGAGGGVDLEHFEKLEPPKGLNADQRAAWWSKQMNAATNALDNW